MLTTSCRFENCSRLGCVGCFVVDIILAVSMVGFPLLVGMSVTWLAMSHTRRPTLDLMLDMSWIVLFDRGDEGMHFECPELNLTTLEY